MSNPNNPDPISSRSDPHGPPLPADPLLRNGSFIDASINRTPDNNNKPQSSSTSLNGSQSATPSKSRRKIPVKGASPPSDSTSWLPPGWLVEDRLRVNGATAGTMDRYYIEPGKGRRFRSKVEVLHYLETGELLKNKRKKEAENSQKDPAEGSGDQKNKKAKKKTKGPQMIFDRVNVPERIEWVLTDANEDVWTPFNGHTKVPEYTKQNWEFEMQLNEGQKKW